MKKNILLLLLTAGLIAFNSGCTSKESSGDEQPVENADTEKIETIDSGTATETATAATPTETKTDAKADAATPPANDASLEAALNDPTTDSAAATPPPATTDTAAAPTVDETSLNNTAAAPPVTDAQLAPDATAATPPPADATAAAPPADVTETPVATGTGIEPTPVAATAPKTGGAPMKKLSEFTPYQAKNGGFVNTVYVARPNEKLADISQKIFGSDKSAELKDITENHYLKSRAPKAGDKIYYVSPNRAEDSTRTISYYEDMGMVPETYVAKKGDNLKKVAKTLLGYDTAWKEVWATNPTITSKSTLKDGDTLRYWKSGGEIMTAAAPTPPPVATGSATITDQAPAATATTAPPPSLPPPPSDAAATMPPPPADTTAAAPPPPPP
ncbi:MAG: hypothetical protein ACXVAX_00550, partial [Pseudobdellovibrio sp.]